MDYQLHELSSECVPESQTPGPSAAAAPSEDILVTVKTSWSIWHCGDQD